jgi:hypothetical protein
MLQTLTRRVFDDIAGFRGSPCVSIFLPTHRFAPEAQANRAEVGRLLKEARDRLTARGFAPSEIEDLLAPVGELSEDPLFWKSQGEGLALFVAPGKLLALRLERAPAIEVEARERFALAPLLPFLPVVDRFYVVAIGLQSPRVLEVSPTGVRRVELSEMPEGIEEELGYEQYYAEVQVHSAAPRGLARQAGIVHGHGEEDEEKQEGSLVRYFRRIARALEALPGDCPRVLAAVATHAPVFHRAGGGEGFVAGMVTGSPERAPDEELARRARGLIESEGEEVREQALARFRELGDRSRAISDVERLVRAAAEGRVETLLVAPGRHRWGTFDPASLEVRLHSEREAGDDDLVDLAVSLTLSMGGSVITMPREAAGTDPLAAVLRY